MEKLNNFYNLIKGSHHTQDIKLEFDSLYLNIQSFNLTGLNDISELENKFNSILDLIISNIKDLNISLKNSSLDTILDLFIEEWDKLNIPDDEDVESQEDLLNLLNNIYKSLNYHFNIQKSS